MSRQTTQNSDKTIVERRVAHKGDQSRQVVKNLRSGSTHSTTQISEKSRSSFDKDVLFRHAKSQPLSQLIHFALSTLAAYSLYSLTSPKIAILWYVIVLLIIFATLTHSWSFRRKDRNFLKISRALASFHMMTLLMGLTWACAFVLIFVADPSQVSTPLSFAAALIATALAFANARFLKGGVLTTVLPFIFVAGIWMILEGNIQAQICIGIMIAFAFCFQYFGNVMREFYIEFLSSRAERDQLVMELNDSRAISDEARRRAEDANLAKSRFLATMSHELRTPLNAILGFSEVMSNEVMGPLDNTYYKEYITDIHRSGAHLLKLINEILDLSRVEAGRYELNEEATNLAHAAEESHQMIKLKALEKNVAVNMYIQPDLPQIWADAKAVRQIILNLLSNALKFTPSGGSIDVKVGWTAGGGQYVAIRDTGPGIPEEEIPIVLSSFGQGSIAIKSAEQGTGLGLPIVQALVHMHDGKFDLKSKLREGTEVIATFPRSRVMEVMSPIAVDTPAGPTQRAAPKFNKIRQKVRAPSLTS